MTTIMAMSQSTRRRAATHESTGAALRAALGRGLFVGRQVKLGVVRGVVIGYNIARRGRYRGARYPLLVKTELGVAKCTLDEVVPA